MQSVADGVRGVFARLGISGSSRRGRLSCDTPQESTNDLALPWRRRLSATLGSMSMFKTPCSTTPSFIAPSIYSPASSSSVEQNPTKTTATSANETPHETSALQATRLLTCLRFEKAIARRWPKRIMQRYKIVLVQRVSRSFTLCTYVRSTNSHDWL